jgi:hypothetical protein
LTYQARIVSATARTIILNVELAAARLETAAGRRIMDARFVHGRSETRTGRDREKLAGGRRKSIEEESRWLTS